MQKKIGIVLAVLIGMSALGWGIFQASESKAEPKLAPEEIRQLVTDQYPGVIIKLELEIEGSKAVYEVEIQKNDREYKVKLNGDTGEILEIDVTLVASANNKKLDDDNDNNDTNTDSKGGNDNVKTVSLNEKSDNKDDGNNNQDHKNSETSDDKDETKDAEEQNSQVNEDKDNEATEDNSLISAAINTVISTNKAKEIALNEFSGTVVGIELDDDDGHIRYEVEVKSSSNEAKIEIDAYTGEIIVLEIDSEDDN